LFISHFRPLPQHPLLDITSFDQQNIELTSIPTAKTPLQNLDLLFCVEIFHGWSLQKKVFHYGSRFQGNTFQRIASSSTII
jgi:hypothetical protein